ncbi:mucin-21 [Bactrocera dorsalis]|uniref:Mucin-21 n=1 Tax=Bactrocera dorsalis TaxID=27457 RepID=A0A6I9VJR2_BACDO|nr:mucin-21 [Bactrocera dorsalis]
MKIFALLFLLACVYSPATSSDVHKSEQKNRFGLVNQRVRSLRDGLGVRFASNTKTPRPVAPLGDGDVDDPWDLGTFFGQFSTKMGSVVKNVVGDVLECVDNVFKGLSPGGNKKGKKDPKDNKGGEGGAGAAGANPSPKPTEAVTIKPTESTTSGSTTVTSTESTTSSSTTSTASTTSGSTTVTSTASTTSGSTTVSSTQSTTTVGPGK